FFFQAEDGIRDFHVTGVQTCALPIWAGDGGLDGAAGWAGPHEPAYLAAGVAGGEGFDWFYASDADRTAQIRTPIADGAHGEDWEIGRASCRERGRIAVVGVRAERWR